MELYLHQENFSGYYDPDTFTPLCDIMEKYGSDKGKCKHNYTTLYYKLFLHLTNKPMNVFELGIGTNNPHLVSSMGVNGKPGASLRGWAEFFPMAEIVGADIDKDILFSENRIQTFFCDQCNPEIIAGMWNKIGKKFDLIIEDGLHEFYANKCFFENSIHMLNPGGFYIVEDIRIDEENLWKKQIEVWKATYPNLVFWYEVLPNNRVVNTFDNILLIVFKKE